MEASQDLVGRPLVPFFDSDDNVNDLLQFAEGDDEREEMKIDARVWDKDLGYFVYPLEQQMEPSTEAKAVAKSRGSGTDSSSKLLLTPSMMLSSGVVNSSTEDGDALQNTTDSARLRSSSAKQGLKPKTRSTTPGRRRKECDRVDMSTPVTLLKKGKSKGSNTNSNDAQSSNNQHLRNGKQKEQLSASGKWAWSAFQSSPDPTELPMPPFRTKSFGGHSNGDEPFSIPASPLSMPCTSPSAQYANMPTMPPLLPVPPLAQAPQPPLPPMPAAPPEVTTATSMSMELLMTQDLRKMLNIGDEAECGQDATSESMSCEGGWSYSAHEWYKLTPQAMVDTTS